MIDTRDALLTAVRRAEITPKGLVVGPLTWVKGASICFGRVTSEAIRRKLLITIKLAGPGAFHLDSTWDIKRHVRKK